MAVGFLAPVEVDAGGDIGPCDAMDATELGS